jgi:hypothetical protein
MNASQCRALGSVKVVCGFNNTSSHGGPIREGLPVRVSYVGNTILKLEIRSGYAPSKSEVWKRVIAATGDGVIQFWPIAALLLGLKLIVRLQKKLHSTAS